MSRRGVGILLLAALLAGAWWVRASLFPSTSRQIRQQLRWLATQASFKPGEGEEEVVSKLSGIAEYVTDEVAGRWQVSEERTLVIRGKKEFLKLLLQMRASARSAQVQFLDILVWKGPEPNEALAHFTMKVELPEENDWIVQEFRVLLMKDGERWKMSRFETVATLEK